MDKFERWVLSAQKAVAEAQNLRRLAANDPDYEKFTTEHRDQLIAEAVAKAADTVKDKRAAGQQRLDAARDTYARQIVEADDAANTSEAKLERIDASQRMHSLLGRGIEAAEILRRAREARDLPMVEAIIQDVSYTKTPTLGEAVTGTHNDNITKLLESAEATAAQLMPEGRAEPRRKLATVERQRQWFGAQMDGIEAQLQQRSGMNATLRAKASGYEPSQAFASQWRDARNEGLAA